jgi:hypothetical protein
MKLLISTFVHVKIVAQNYGYFPTDQNIASANLIWTDLKSGTEISGFLSFKELIKCEE